MPKLVRPVSQQQKSDKVIEEGQVKRDKVKEDGTVQKKQKEAKLEKAVMLIKEETVGEKASKEEKVAKKKEKKDKNAAGSKKEKSGAKGKESAVAGEAEHDKENLVEGNKVAKSEVKEAKALVKEAEKKEPEGKAPPAKEDVVRTVEPAQIGKCVDAFQQLLKVFKAEKKDLLEDEETKKVFLQVSGIKLPRISDKHIIKARLPHSPLPEDADILLIVKDLEKGIKVDHESTVLHFKSLLSDAGVKNISEVISLRQLKVEYKQFEAKNQLCNRFEVVLADDRIVRLLPHLLGKPFYKKKKLPVPVNLTSKSLKQEVERCIHTSLLPLNNHGSCAMLPIGHSGMSKANLSDNISAGLKVLENRYPGGWINVRSVHVASGTTSLPLYMCARTTLQVGKVETSKSKHPREWVEDELSTLPGATVTVTPFGSVRVKRKADPEWDTLGIEKMDKAVEDKEQEEEENKEEEQQKKQENKKLKKENKNKKKKTKQEESESEDEMEDKETEYMRKVAEEEEEIERREEENRIKLGLPAEKVDSGEEDDDDADDDGEDEEEDIDDDVEAENLLSDDEEDGVNSEGEEEDEELILQQRQQTEEQKSAKKKNKKKEHKQQEKLNKKQAKKKEGIRHGKVNKEAKQKKQQHKSSKAGVKSDKSKKFSGTKIKS